MTTGSSTTAPQSSTVELSALTQLALERISVTRPYFALTDLALTSDGESITASVPPGPPASPEVGAMAAGQIARHLAILGSCAAAVRLESDKRHHYLAMGASYERLGVPATAPVDELMRATATAEWQDKRTAVATMTLSDPTGAPLNRLKVTYAVMKPAMFERLNPRLDTPDDTTAETGGPIIVEESRGVVVADYGPVPAELCAGHFPGHPVAPIALVMGRLVLTTRHALCSQLGGEVTYRVEGGTVEATGLAQPGQRLVLEANYEMARRDGTHLLAGRALADGVEVGAVQVDLAAVTGQVDDDLRR